METLKIFESNKCHVPCLDETVCERCWIFFSEVCSEMILINSTLAIVMAGNVCTL